MKSLLFLQIKTLYFMSPPKLDWSEWNKLYKSLIWVLRIFGISCQLNHIFIVNGCYWFILLVIFYFFIFILFQQLLGIRLKISWEIHELLSYCVNNLQIQNLYILILCFWRLFSRFMTNKIYVFFLKIVLEKMSSVYFISEHFFVALESMNLNTCNIWDNVFKKYFFKNILLIVVLGWVKVSFNENKKHFETFLFIFNSQYVAW